MKINDGRMPSTFIAAALSGEPLPVHGDGSQTRSLCFVTDTARGLIAAMERGASGEVYNIGRSDEISVLDFARMVARVVDTQSEIQFIPGRPQDIQRRCPDTTKAERALEWSATTGLEEGLRVTLGWYRLTLPSAPPRELAAS
jgi:nucleoside-diphosphate-sugar epimerase